MKKHPYPKLRRIFLILLVLPALLTACADPPPKPAPDPVRIHLKWRHQAQFAGFYLAREQGLYDAENLDVSFIEGGPETDKVGALLTGQVDFAVLAPEDILLNARAKNPPVAIAAIYRRSALMFISLADSGITQPMDFQGKTIAIGEAESAAREFGVQFLAMMKKLDIDTDQMRIAPYDATYASLLNRDVQVSPAYLTGGVIRLRQQGHKLNLIWPGDYDIHGYSDVLAVRADDVHQRPDIILRFLRASLLGWRRVLSHPEDALQSTLKYAVDSDMETQKAMLRAQVPLVHTGEDHIGWMNHKMWESTVGHMRDSGLLTLEIDSLDRIFTMAFLQQVYGDRKR
ncbi:MAG: ABC transporter substrate-binding protein [Desulfatirhabdiaceae bacterium]